jgi:hypothetical protein
MASRSPIEPTLDGIAARPELAHQIPREAAKRLQLDALAVALVIHGHVPLPLRLAKQIVACLARARVAEAEEPANRIGGNRQTQPPPTSRLRLIRGGLRRQLEGLSREDA